MVWEQLAPERVMLSLSASTQEQVLKQMGQVLVQEGYCKSSYVEALIAREKENPTGLDILGFGIAIPHTDQSHVHQDGLAIGVLDQPVKFIAMGSDDDCLEVRIIFMMAITDPNRHLEQIQALLHIFQDKTVLEQIQDAQTAEEVIQIIKQKEDVT